VNLHLATSVDRLEKDDRLTGVRLSDGTRLKASVALMATGATPNTEWLAGSGLLLDPGVVCGTTCEAVGGRNVFAAGDVARWPHPLIDGALARIEHWSNAAEQGTAAALNLLAPPDGRTPYAPVPSFWSDQYDVRIRSVGFPTYGDSNKIVEGSIAQRRFVAGYQRAGRLIGAVAVNMGQRLPWYRRAIADRREWREVVHERGNHETPALREGDR
jgi:NADPH-dependent 2,4-dienoyl-CoA reductase/sulfur reductase-like enzyme